MNLTYLVLIFQKMMKNLKVMGLGKKGEKKAHFDAKRIPVINKCKNKLERIICIQGTDMPFLLEAK